MDGCRIAVIGATGAVGSVFLSILEERSFPATEVRLCASERSWGRKLTVLGEERTVEEATPELLGEVDLVFVCAGSGISREIGPLAVDNGASVVDKSSAFRMDPDVPLVIPEINGDDLESHQGIVSVPNCSTAPLAMTLKPLMGVNAIERVVVSTYQSVSGRARPPSKSCATSPPPCWGTARSSRRNIPTRSRSTRSHTSKRSRTTGTRPKR